MSKDYEIKDSRGNVTGTISERSDSRSSESVETREWAMLLLGYALQAAFIGGIAALLGALLHEPISIAAAAIYKMFGGSDAFRHVLLSSPPSAVASICFWWTFLGAYVFLEVRAIYRVCRNTARWFGNADNRRSFVRKVLWVTGTVIAIIVAVLAWIAISDYAHH